VAQDDDPGHLILVRSAEAPADDGNPAEGLEELRRDLLSSNDLGLIEPGQGVVSDPATRAQVVERRRLIAVVQVVRRRHGSLWRAAERSRAPHDPIRIGVGQGIQQHSLHDAEDGRVQADPQGEREHDDGGQPGALSQTPEREPDVSQRLSEQLGSACLAALTSLALLHLAPQAMQIAEPPTSLCERLVVGQTFALHECLRALLDVVPDLEVDRVRRR